MVMSSRASLTGVCAAFTSGKSMRNPVVSSGAVTMNTTKSTNITSTSGVTLMSRKPRRALPTLSAIRRNLARERHCLAAVSRVLHQQGDPAFGGSADLLEQIGDALVDVIVADRGRNRGDEAERGGDQRLADRRRHDRQRCALLHADAQERIHDAPHGAEQPDERGGRGDTRKRRHQGG